ncbi:late histone H2B.L4-like [Lemur catta]|uniref:late histone H2B.L4-like n=1 Tax=Lemur catta TaxID=9447 RepID=UPI001E26CAB1|nr:late histone H2B.L4-like [Lemur catta]
MAEPSSELSTEARPGATGPEEAESTMPQKHKQKQKHKQEQEQKQKQPRRRGRRSSRRGGSFATYFARIVRQFPGRLRLSQEAVSVMDSFVHDMLERIGEEAGRLARYTEHATITTREIQTAVRLMMPGHLGRNAVTAGIKAVLRHTRSQ